MVQQKIDCQTKLQFLPVMPESADVLANKAVAGNAYVKAVAN